MLLPTIIAIILETLMQAKSIINPSRGRSGNFLFVYKHVRLRDADQLRHGLGHTQVIDLVPLSSGLVPYVHLFAGMSMSV